MHYKGFEATYYYVGDLGIYVGEVVDNPNRICFAANNLTDLKEVMCDALDNYLIEKQPKRILVEEPGGA